MLLREPFQFAFRGYSVWLEVRQTDGDLDKAIAFAALEGGLYPIVEPHVTVAYGFTHLSEEEARNRFRNDLAHSIKEWPALETKGSHFGVEHEGHEDGEMDMSWIEVSLASSDQHEKLVSKVYSIFCDNCEKESTPARYGPWKPHICKLSNDIFCNFSCTFILSLLTKNSCVFQLWPMTTPKLPSWMVSTQTRFLPNTLLY